MKDKLLKSIVFIHDPVNAIFVTARASKCLIHRDCTCYGGGGYTCTSLKERSIAIGS
jgi:hypothetical protein